ncbi:MAG: histidine kinase dimerization/phospho-acceptor domain-containing protein, partial [Candidatus Limnocylindrales bacterium]
MTQELDAVPGGILVLAADLRIVGANRSLAELVGRTQDELLGQPLDLLLSMPARILFQTHVYPALRSDRRVEEVFLTLTAADGTDVPILLNATRSSDDRGEDRYDALVIRIRARSRWETDLLSAARALEEERASSQRLTDELKAALEDLAARNAEQRRNDAFRDAFAGVVSHELRTPITTIFGMSHLLRQHYATMEPADIGKRLEDIQDEAERLRRLTENLLVLSRAEGGRLASADDPIALTHVVRRTIESERRRSEGYTLDVAIDPDLPLV